MFKELEEINFRPEPFQYYTAEELWNEEHTSKKMLEFHLNESIDVSSRNINFVERSVDWICSYFKVDDMYHICDFGCGPGLYSNRLAERGACVTGIDFSARSIQYAKKITGEKKLEIKYILDNYLDYETDKRFDLIIMIMCDFCALSPTQRKHLLQKFHRFLNPNGKLLLDVYSLVSFEQRDEQSICELNLLDGFWSPHKYYGFLNTFKYIKEKIILDKYTIVERNRKREIYNWLQYFSKETLIAEFESNQFKVENLYSDVAGSKYDSKSGEMAVVCKKAI